MQLLWFIGNRKDKQRLNFKMRVRKADGEAMPWVNSEAQMQQVTRPQDAWGHVHFCLEPSAVMISRKDVTLGRYSQRATHLFVCISFSVTLLSFQNNFGENAGLDLHASWLFKLCSQISKWWQGCQKTQLPGGLVWKISRCLVWMSMEHLGHKHSSQHAHQPTFSQSFMTHICDTQTATRSMCLCECTETCK